MTLEEFNKKGFFPILRLIEEGEEAREPEYALQLFIKTINEKIIFRGKSKEYESQSQANTKLKRCCVQFLDYIEYLDSEDFWYGYFAKELESIKNKSKKEIVGFVFLKKDKRIEHMIEVHYQMGKDLRERIEMVLEQRLLDITVKVGNIKHFNRYTAFSELRHGNWVIYNGKVERVKRISDEFWVPIGKTERRCKFEEMFPVPLTNLLLRSNGFKEVRPFCYQRSFLTLEDLGFQEDRIKAAIEGRTPRSGFWIEGIPRFGKFKLDQIGEVEAKLMSDVHQFQNFFKALFGTDLDLKHGFTGQKKEIIDSIYARVS